MERGAGAPLAPASGLLGGQWHLWELPAVREGGGSEMRWLLWRWLARGTRAPLAPASGLLGGQWHLWELPAFREGGGSEMRRL